MGKNINIVSNADDTAPIVSNEDDLPILLYHLNTTAKQFVTEISSSQTNTMVIENKLDRKINEHNKNFNYFGQDVCPAIKKMKRNNWR